MENINLPILKPVNFDLNNKPNLEYGKYLVVRKCGKKHLETWNGTGWAYNHSSIVAYYSPKIY